MIADRQPEPDDRVRETIIIGAGIAGLACARRLHDAGRSFFLISPEVGGRIRRSGDGAVNLGAYYVRADYTHVNEFVVRGRRINRLEVRRYDSEGRGYTYWSRRLLLHAPQVVRFLWQLVRFRRRYERFKRRTVTVGQAAALRSDPLLWGLWQQTASEFIAQHRIGHLARWYLGPGLHGTTFSTLAEISAFTLLLGALPAIVPAYEFTLRVDRLVAGISNCMVSDAVTHVTRLEPGYCVETSSSGSWLAEHVVIAAPIEVAKRLLPLPVIKKPVGVHMFEIAGKMKSPYGQADIHLFPESEPTFALARQAGGIVLFASSQRHPDFDRFFDEWRVIEHVQWDPAFHLLGNALLAGDLGAGIYLACDHNIVGLEEAFLTGLYAANQIIIRAQSRRAAHDVARWSSPRSLLSDQEPRARLSTASRSGMGR